MNKEIQSSLSQRIEAIESGYEFLLAYAAQGRETDKGASDGQDVRKFLNNMDTAMQGLGEACKEAAEAKDGPSADEYKSFLDAVQTDAERAQGLIRLVLKQANVSSQLVDNLNANVHLRTLLTDMFILDETLNPAS